MTTPCPHCKIQIEIDEETLATLQGHAHFQCPACSGLVPMPSAARAPVKVTASAIRPASAAAEPTASTLASAHRGLNRNFLILGAAALLVLGVLGFFLASKNTGDTTATTQNIRNEIINNAYFQNLIATGVTTIEDLEALEMIHPYEDGFIGLSKGAVNWKAARVLANRSGSVILQTDQHGGGFDKALISWIARTFTEQAAKTLWVRSGGKAATLGGTEVLLTKETDAERLVLLHWGSSKSSGAPSELANSTHEISDFGEQDDTNHERKLAISIASGKGVVTINSAGNIIDCDQPEKLPDAPFTIQKIWCVKAPFSEEDARNLNGCSDIKSLTIHRSNVRSLPFKSLSSLEFLEIVWTPLQAANLKDLKAHPKIQTLILGDIRNGGENGILNLAASLPVLERLWLHRCDIYGLSMIPLANLEKLGDLSISDPDFRIRDLQPLSKVGALHTLDMHGFNVNNDDYEVLGSFPLLEFVTISHRIIPREALITLSEMEGLKHLRLNDCQFENQSIEDFVPPRSLESLELSRTDLIDDSLGTVERFKNLRRLKLPGTIATEALDRLRQVLTDCEISY